LQEHDAIRGKKKKKKKKKHTLYAMAQAALEAVPEILDR